MVEEANGHITLNRQTFEVIAQFGRLSSQKRCRQNKIQSMKHQIGDRIVAQRICLAGRIRVHRQHVRWKVCVVVSGGASSRCCCWCSQNRHNEHDVEGMRVLPGVGFLTNLKRFESVRICISWNFHLSSITYHFLMIADNRYFPFHLGQPLFSHR